MKIWAIIAKLTRGIRLRGVPLLACGAVFLLSGSPNHAQQKTQSRPATSAPRSAPANRAPAGNSGRPAMNTSRPNTNTSRPNTNTSRPNTNTRQGNTTHPTTSNTLSPRTTTQTGARTTTTQGSAGVHATSPRTTGTQTTSHGSGQAGGAHTNTAGSGHEGSKPNGSVAGGHTNTSGSGHEASRTTGAGRPTVTHLNGGNTRESYANGANVNRDHSGHPTEYHNTRTGVHANFDHNGHVSQISKTGANGSHMNIHRGPGNERRIESVRSVHGGVERMVSYGHNRGFYEHPMAGRPGYMQRTVIVNGRVYAGVYRHYYFHGVYLNSPVPAIVFAPAYYGWLLSPWQTRVVYTPAYWGWAGQPWYGYYSPYFTPYPVYGGPEQWLADYLISESLQQAYEDQQAQNAAANAAVGTPPQITDEEKALIAEDIKNQLAREKQAVANNAYSSDNATTQTPPPSDNQAGQQQQATTETPEALQDHLFTVYAAPIEAKTTSGETCNLTEGDMLFRKSDTPNDDNTVDVIVKGSHADSGHPDFCAKQTQAKVQLADLQDMYVHKHELLAEGMQKQADLMGKKGGIPKGPKANPTKVPGGQATPDDQAVAELKKQILEGDDAEKEVTDTATPVS